MPMALKPAQLAASVGWKLETQLGEGGQGSVFVAVRETDPNGQKYAFKFLKDKAGGKARDRFRQELKALTTFNHPGIVKVIEHAETEDGPQYYVMEFVEGFDSLKKRIDRQTNPFHRQPLQAVDGFIQIIEALAACEQRGIVHRDLSPANVLVDDHGTIKLIDFGLCYIDGDQTITLTDEAVGTPLYRAPECSSHWRGDPDIRADLYSAGKILWSMMTSKYAFDREARVFNDLSLFKLLPDLPPAWHLFHIFEHTIRQDPNIRFANTENTLAAARGVRRLITNGNQPLEQLATDLCPFCGVGRFGTGTMAFVSYYKLELEDFGKNMLPVTGAYSLCPFCFHATFAAGDALRKALGDRTKLS